MKTITKYIDSLIQDFDKMDDIEKDRIKQIITECYQMSEKTPRELLATGLYTVEEIEALFPEKLKEYYIFFFQVELEHIYSDMNTLINNYSFMGVLSDHGENFFGIFNYEVAVQKLSKLQVFMKALDHSVCHYINPEEIAFTLLTNLKDIRSSFSHEDAKTKDMLAEYYNSDPRDYKLQNSIYSKEIAGFRFEGNCLDGMPRIPKQIEQYIPSGDDFENDCVYTPSKAREPILQMFNECIDCHLSLYLRFFQILNQTMRRDFLRYIGKRLFIQKKGL